MQVKSSCDSVTQSPSHAQCITQETYKDLLEIAGLSIGPETNYSDRGSSGFTQGLQANA